MHMRAAWTAFWIASVYFLFEFVTRVEPSLSADAVSRHYHLTDAGFGTLASLFFWVYAPMQIVVGLLLDRYGARRFVLARQLRLRGRRCLVCAPRTMFLSAAWADC